MVTTVMEHSRFFCYMAKQIESHKGITNIRTVEKVMPQQISSNGFAGGCFLTYAVFGGISPLTCTIFDPIFTALISPVFRLSHAHKSCHSRMFQLCFSKSAHTGQNKCWSVTLSTFVKQGHKSAHGRSQGEICFSFSLLSNRHSSAFTHSAQAFRQMLQCLSQYFYCFS